MLGIEQRSGRFNRGAEHRDELGRSLLQLQSSPSDPRYVEQVIEEAAHVRYLPLHDLVRPFSLLRGPFRLAVGGECIADWREWIAKLVGEQRQELVLPAVGF